MAKRPKSTIPRYKRRRQQSFGRRLLGWLVKLVLIFLIGSALCGLSQNMPQLIVIRADGSLERAEISRSSGKKVLDEAALRIVRLAAPFAPFPPDIARDTDILSITRTWSFTLADQFQAE